MGHCNSKSLLLLVAAAAFVLQEGTAAAGVFPISQTSGEQYEPDVTYNPGGDEFLVVFKDEGVGNMDIQGQLLSGSGALVGSAFSVSPTDVGFPAAAGKDGQYLVVWVDSVVNWDNISAQRVSGTGTLVGGVILVDDTTHFTQRQPDVAYSSGVDKYLVVWTDDKDSGGADWDIYGKLVASDGTTSGRISIDTATPDGERPKVAYNSTDDEFLVVWHSGGNVVGRRVSSTGNPLGVTFTINNTTGASSPRAAVAYNGIDNQYLVVWQAKPGVYYDIMGQRLNNTGVAVGGAITIYASGEETNWRAQVAFSNPQQLYKVVWEQAESVMGVDVYGRDVNRDGTMPAAAYPISANANVWEEAPSVASRTTDSGEFLTVWEDNRNPTTGTDIYGYHVAAGHSIPALSRWGLIALMVLLLAVTMYMRMWKQGVAK